MYYVILLKVDLGLWPFLMKPAGTDQSFIQKLYAQLDKLENKNVGFGNTSFTIAHYAVDVTYEVDVFIEKKQGHRCTGRTSCTFSFH